jgi:hypothetical protein
MADSENKNMFLRALDSLKSFFSSIWESFMKLIGRGKPTGTRAPSTERCTYPASGSIGASTPSTTATSVISAPTTASATDPHAARRAELDRKIAPLEAQMPAILAEYTRTQEYPGPNGKDHEAAAAIKTKAEAELFELRAQRYVLGDTSGKPRNELLKIKMVGLIDELELALKETSSTKRLDGITSGPLLSIKSSLGMQKQRLTIGGEELFVTSCVELEKLIKEVHEHQDKDKAIKKP